jgi:hypothetical protein
MCAGDDRPIDRPTGPGLPHQIGAIILHPFNFVTRRFIAPLSKTKQVPQTHEDDTCQINLHINWQP